MTGEDNQIEKSEIAELKKELDTLTAELGNKNKDVMSLEDNHGETLSPSKAKSVEFVSAKYDDLAAFKKTVMEELGKLNQG